MKKFLFLVLSLYGFVGLCFSQKIINGKTDKAEYMIGDRIEYSFSLPNDKDNTVSTDYAFSDTLRFISQKTDTSKGQIHYQITLSSFIDGNTQLPTYYVYKQGLDSAICIINSPIIKVNVPVIDTINIETKPLKDIIKTPITFKEVLPFIIGVIVLAITVVATIFIVKRIRQQRKSTPQPTPIFDNSIPEDIEAIKSLNALKEEHYIERNLTKQHYITLTDIVWKYILRRFGINAFEMTTNQILDSLQQVQVSQEDMDKVKHIFNVSDLVKFAKHIPSITENMSVMQESFDFVNSTKRVAVPTEQTGKEENV
ncbi:MAG: hypothetical protein IJ213_03775 [Bacteroidales bacterium]|nr:hypothetical protein [Bacteroidales bacterium]